MNLIHRSASVTIRTVRTMHILRSSTSPKHNLRHQHADLTDELRRSRWAQKLALVRFTRTNRLPYLAEYNALTSNLLAGIARLDAIEAELQQLEAVKNSSGFVQSLGTTCKQIVRKLARRP